MKLKKLPKDISNEDLVNALEDPNNPEVLDKPSEHSVLLFLADFGIYPGNKEIQGRLLYKLYYYHSDNPVSSVEFNLLLSSYLEYTETNNTRYYRLNRAAQDLTKKLAQYLASKKVNKKLKNPHYRKHFEYFLESHGLEKGNSNFPAQALFYYYDKWQHGNGFKTRLIYTVFLEMARLYFDTKRTSRYWCVLKINKSFFDSHKKDMNTALEWGSKYNGRKKEIFSKEKKK